MTFYPLSGCVFSLHESNIKHAAGSSFQRELKITEDLPSALRPLGSALRGTKETQIRLKISWILWLDMVSVFFSILNSCDAIKSQCASQQKWLSFKNERNDRCVQLAD